MGIVWIEIIERKKIELISDVLHKLVDHLGLPTDYVNRLTKGTMKLIVV